MDLLIGFAEIPVAFLARVNTITRTKQNTTKRDKNMTKMPAYKCLSPVILGCLLLAIALAACSSVKTHVDKAPVTARTFSFLNTGREIPNYAEDRRQAHVAIQQALINNLASKGVSYVATGGDITVAYLVVVGNNATTTSLNSYFGYTDDAEAMVKQVHKEQTSSQESRGYFEAGTLVIDILDPKTSKLLQRRTVQAEVLRNLPVETRTARVQSLVDDALKDISISR